MKVAISGSSGLVGSALVSMFKQQGDEVTTLNRDLLYGPAGDLSRQLKGTKVVIHLAGAPIISRWTEKNKEIIYNSRIQTTRNVVNAMEMLPEKPEVFICASAAHIYPEEGIHTEESNAVAPTFLGKVVSDWEKEAGRAKAFCRTLNLRTTMVLSSKGGALKTMLPPFRLWVGGKVGSGMQTVCWIHLEDFKEIVKFVINKKELSGPVNVATPYPVTNATLSEILGKTIGRPSWNRVPPFLLYLMYGKGARVVAHGLNVVPAKLLEAGFKYKFPHIEQALKQELG